MELTGPVRFASRKIRAVVRKFRQAGHEIRRFTALRKVNFMEVKEQEKISVRAERLGSESRSQALRIPCGEVTLSGDLQFPPNAVGLVLFAHGSGSSRFSRRNRAVAGVLRASGVATLLFDLLTEDEEAVDSYTAHLRFDIGLLTRRLVTVTEEMADDPRVSGLGLGYFGSSTGGAAALRAAAALGSKIKAVVSRGGRPDLAGDALRYVKAATLLIVGERDE